MSRRTRAAAFVTGLAIAMLAGAGLPAISAAAAPRASLGRPLSLGFYDEAFTGTDGSTWLGRAAAAGSNVIRIDIGWAAPNTPTAPAGFNALDPASPDYDFAAADAAVKAATADGMQVILDFNGAPRWAEGPRMPRDAMPGTWEPNAAAVGAYATALATRYSGHFPDPADPGQMLPRVWAFQVWNEPNLSNYLEPQWSGRTATAPIRYRSMLNAAYNGVKSVDPGALVVTAGTAPFGDPEVGGQRIQPAAFWRDALCVRLQGRRLVGEHCRDPAHFDVLAHHPYSVGAPTTQAINADDVSIPDIGKLSAILRVAERSGGALPRVRHPIWVTEVGYNTKPPNPAAVPLHTAALWLEQTLWLLWSQGVSAVTWNTIVDQAPDPTYSTTNQSGIYFLNGQPKPGLTTAFGFPVVASRQGSTVTVWGRSPAAGQVAIQQLSGHQWRPIANVKVNIGNTFLAHFVDIQKLTVRAVVGTAVSLPWTLP